MRTLENSALQGKAIMKNLFYDIKTTEKNKLGSILDRFTQGLNRREQVDLNDCDNKTCTSTQFFSVTTETVLLSAGAFVTLLQCFSYLWFQQGKIWSQPDKTLFVTRSC